MTDNTLVKSATTRWQMRTSCIAVPLTLILSMYVSQTNRHRCHITDFFSLRGLIAVSDCGVTFSQIQKPPVATGELEAGF